MKLVIPPDIKQVPKVLNQLKKHFSSKKLELILEEALVNVITHAQLTSHDTIAIDYTISKSEISISIKDKGIFFNPKIYKKKPRMQPLTDIEIGGAGLRLIHAYTDTIDYKREKNHNILTLTYKRTA